MARSKDREKALILRAQGKSYSQIKAILKISKSTLSYWLKDHPLPIERIRELRDWNEKRIERYRETRRQTKEIRLKKIYQKEKKIVLPLSRRDLYVAGLFLYWGEGTKTARAMVELTNTDPSVIKFFIKWLTLCFGVSREKMRVKLHLYVNMNTKKETLYWSKILEISESQFRKPYVKKSSSKAINHKGTFGHGTCKVVVGNARLLERILAGIKIAREHSLKY